MEVFLASANPSEIEKAYKLPIAGVLTNSSILKIEKMNLGKLIAAVDCIGTLPFGLQIASTQEEQMLQEFKLFHTSLKNRTLHLKIPYCQDAFNVVRKLRDLDIPLNITGVSTLAQACLALESDIDYLSIYVGRVTDAGGDGLGLLTDIKNYATQAKKKTKILAASIRNLDHFEEVILRGADAVAIPYALLIEALQSDITDQSIKGFQADWDQIEKEE